MPKETPTQETPAKADKLVRVYIKIREAREALTKKDRDLEAQQDLVTEELLDLCKATGTESLKTVHGTAIRGKRTTYWTNDWDAFFQFMAEHDVMLVQRRIAVGALEEFMQEYPDTTPPGLQSDSKYTISVRRNRS